MLGDFPEALPRLTTRMEITPTSRFNHTSILVGLDLENLDNCRCRFLSQSMCMFGYPQKLYHARGMHATHGGSSSPNPQIVLLPPLFNS